MLDLLAKGPRTAAELAAPFAMNKSTISEHIRALRVAGIVTYRARGAKYEFTLDRARLNAIEQRIRGFRQTT
jgi:DNA-binding IclR family transcriptional regulator